MFPKACTYDHTFAIFVKIAATVFWKRYKLGTDGSHNVWETEHTAMVMSRQNQVCTPVEIGSAIFWVMGKKNIYGFRDFSGFPISSSIFSEVSFGEKGL